MMQLLLSSLVYANTPIKTVFKSANRPSIDVHSENEKGLSNFAKINMQQAIQSARQNSDGKLIESSLEKRNDYLVYRVAFAECNKRFVQVFIDAGTGNLLQKEIIQH